MNLKILMKIKVKSLNINPINNNIYEMCDICEHIYNMNKLFAAKCENHYICKRCKKLL